MQKLTEARYARDFRFEVRAVCAWLNRIGACKPDTCVQHGPYCFAHVQDPLQKQNTFAAFKANLSLLRAVFNITFDTHKVEVQNDTQVVSW